MSIEDEGARASSIERHEKGRPDDAPAPSAGGSRTGLVLGSLLGLLLLAGAVYYFTGNRPDTTVATGPSVKQPSVDSATATQPLPPQSAEKPAASAENPVASSTMPPQPAAPQSPPPQATASSQQPPAAPPAPATSTAEAPKVPAETKQDTAENAPGNTTAAAAESPPARTRQSTASPPSSDAQQPMRDQPAALPDQSAAAPKTEVVLVVKRGPANIRSAPGKGGRVIGTAAKDAQLKELSRSGSWVEVETESGRGWISAGLLAPL